jgi:hypothetical protein
VLFQDRGVCLVDGEGGILVMERRWSVLSVARFELPQEPVKYANEATWRPLGHWALTLRFSPLLFFLTQTTRETTQSAARLGASVGDPHARRTNIGLCGPAAQSQHQLFRGKGAH